MPPAGGHRQPAGPHSRQLQSGPVHHHGGEWEEFEETSLLFFYSEVW